MRRPVSRSAFLDSSGYLALVNPNDAHHADAKAVWTRLTEEGWWTFTTNFVVAETHALFLIRLGHPSATAFLRQSTLSSTEVVRANGRDEDRAREIIFHYDDKDFSVTDAISFAVMERLRLFQAYGYDRHFTQFGFTLLKG